MKTKKQGNQPTLRAHQRLLKDLRNMADLNRRHSPHAAVIAAADRWVAEFDQRLHRLRVRLKVRPKH